ncbi:MAG: c-type cytochrome [Candidatus Binatia bacterium]
MRVILQLLAALAFAELLFVATTPAQTKGDANAGKNKYESLCVGCHGAEGKGDGPAAGGLNPRPADLSDPAHTESLSDQYLFEIIKEGGPKVKKSPLMPGWVGALNDKEIWNVIAYLKTLPARKTTK